MHKLVHLYSIFLSITICTLIISCSENNEIHTEIHTAYFIDSTTVGFVISNYEGGGGLPTSPDEHVHDYSQKVLIYDIKTDSLTVNGVIDNKHPFGGVGAIAEGNILLTNFGIFENDNFSYYSLQGVELGTVPMPTLPSGFYVKLSAISPNGRYLLLSTYKNIAYASSYGYLYDLVTKTYSATFSMPENYITCLENNGLNFIFQTNVDYPKRESFLTRQNFFNNTIDTLLQINGYKKIFITPSHNLLFKNPQGYAGYFVIDTLENPKARFISLNVKSSVVDVDMVTGRYLVQNETEVLLGNYKNGDTEKRILSQ